MAVAGFLRVRETVPVGVRVARVGAKAANLLEIEEPIAVRVRVERVRAERELLGVGEAVEVGVDGVRRGAEDEELEGVEEPVAVEVVAGSKLEESGRDRRPVRGARPDDVGVDGDAVERREDDVRDRDAGCVVDVRLARRARPTPRERGSGDGERDGVRRGGVRGKEQPARIQKIGRTVELPLSMPSVA